MDTHEKAKNYHCPDCNVRFTQLGSMYKHRHQYHATEGAIAKFHCKQCTFSFRREIELQKHINSVHNGIKTLFKCPECGEKFTRYFNTNKHIRHKHSEKYPELKPQRITVQVRKTTFNKPPPEADTPIFQCTRCEYTTKELCKLRLHKRVKHEGFRYFCPICNQAFSRKDTATDHISDKHPDAGSPPPLEKKQTNEDSNNGDIASLKRQGTSPNSSLQRKKRKKAADKNMSTILPIKTEISSQQKVKQRLKVTSESGDNVEPEKKRLKHSTTWDNHPTAVLTKKELPYTNNEILLIKKKWTALMDANTQEEKLTESLNELRKYMDTFVPWDQSHWPEVVKKYNCWSKEATRYLLFSWGLIGPASINLQTARLFKATSDEYLHTLAVHAMQMEQVITSLNTLRTRISIPDNGIFVTEVPWKKAHLYLFRLLFSPDQLEKGYNPLAMLEVLMPDTQIYRNVLKKYVFNRMSLTIGVEQWVDCNEGVVIEQLDTVCNSLRQKAIPVPSDVIKAGKANIGNSLHVKREREFGRRWAQGELIEYLKLQKEIFVFEKSDYSTSVNSNFYEIKSQVHVDEQQYSTTLLALCKRYHFQIYELIKKSAGNLLVDGEEIKGIPVKPIEGIHFKEDHYLPHSIILAYIHRFGINNRDIYEQLRVRGRIHSICKMIDYSTYQPEKFSPDDLIVIELHDKEKTYRFTQRAEEIKGAFSDKLMRLYKNGELQEYVRNRWEAIGSYYKKLPPASARL